MVSSEKMHFLYASDERFIPVLQTSLYSLLKVHGRRSLTVHIVLDGNVSPASRSALADMCAQFGQELNLIPMPDFNSESRAMLDIKRYSSSMFSRLAAGSLLPDDLHRLIYLDCDTMICDDLYPLWTIDLKGKTLGAVNDLRSIAYNRNLGIRPGNCYINSGVLVMDLQRYRAGNWEKRLYYALGQLNGLLEFPDNDLICKMMQDEICLLPMRYNVISVASMCSHRELLCLRRPAVRVDRETYEAAVRNPAIVHFTTFFMMQGRPWIAGCNHPLAERYAALRMEATGREPDAANVKKGAIRSLADRIIPRLPRRMVISLFGVLHIWLKPWLQGRKMQKCRAEYPLKEA